VPHAVERRRQEREILREPLLDAHVAGQRDDHDLLVGGLGLAEHVLRRRDDLRPHRDVQEGVVEGEDDLLSEAGGRRGR